MTITALVAVAFFFAVLCIILWLRQGRIEQRHEEEIRLLQKEFEKTKQVNVDKQRAVIKGQLAEQFYPLSGHCNYLPSDMRFLGMPLDYIVFDGYTECKDNDGSFREIVFVEIKSGSSQLSRHQRQIRDAINAGRVRWETINV